MIREDGTHTCMGMLCVLQQVEQRTYYLAIEKEKQNKTETILRNP